MPRSRHGNPRSPSRAARYSAEPAAIDRYLKDLAQTPPLSAEQEAALSHRIQEAEREQLNAIVDSGIALPELAEMAARIRAGTVGRDALVDKLADSQPNGNELRTLLETIADGEARLSELRSREVPGAAAARRALREERSRVIEQRRGALARLPVARDLVERIVQRVSHELEQLADAESAIDDVAREAGLSPDAIAHAVDRDEDRPTSGSGRSEDLLAAHRTIMAQRRRIEQSELELGLTHAELGRVGELVGRVARRLRRAKDELLKSNLRLVVMFAKKYRGQGVAFDDLIQEGNVGLLRAADKYDHRVGTRFSTYAAWWVRQAMQRAMIAQASDVRLPVHISSTRRRVNRAATALANRLGREPEPKEIAKAMGIDVYDVIRSREAGTQTVSLESPVGVDGRSFGDHLADEQAEAADVAVARIAQKQVTLKLLERLSVREREVLRLRFGLGGCRTHTLREIGERINVSRERVRQIESKALDKLRHHLDDSVTS